MKPTTKEILTAHNTSPNLSQIANIIYQNDDLLVLQTMAYSNEAIEKAMLHKNQNSFGQFNLGLHVNDNPKQVLDNRCQLMKQLNQYLVTVGLKQSKITQVHWLEQVHGNQVINTAHINQLLTMQPKQADAMVTDKQGVALAIMTADCVPIVLSSELSSSATEGKKQDNHQQSNNQQSSQIAAIHAGWKGLANGIVAQTINQFSQKQTPICAWIGASIGVDAYEVSHEVCNQLVQESLKNVFAHTEVLLTPEQLTKKITKPHNDCNKVWLDIHTLATLQLQALGCDIKSDKIPCSYENSRYYSYRRKTHLQQPHTGRMAMLVIKLSS